MERSDDAALAIGLRNGNREAWLAVYDRYAEAIWHYVARRLAADPTSVADVVQETMLAAAASAARYEPERGTLEQWLLGIAWRQVVRHYRNTPARREVLGLTSVWKGLRPSASANKRDDDPASSLTAAESSEMVRRALAYVAPEQRWCLIEKYMNGHSLEEIARLTCRSPSSVGSLLARGRRAFRKAWFNLCSAAQAQPGESHEARIQRCE